jgi:DNA-binding MarR family transcriptional regulator
MNKTGVEKKQGTKDGRSTASLKVLPALSKKQRDCLIFIFNYYSEHRHFPTHREIAEAMGSSSTTAAMYLDPLVEKGYLRRVGKGKVARNIRVTNDGLERLRLLGVNIQNG